MSNLMNAAEKLFSVHMGGPRIAGLGADTPADMAGVWAIQREVLRRMGGTIGGWKCAAPEGQPQTGAMLDARGVRRGPTTWQVKAGETIGLETEIAFRLGRDLPRRATRYSREEVLDAVAGAFPAIELVTSRYVERTAVSLMEAMADGISHAGLILGEDVPGWRGMDLPKLTVRQTYAGQVQVEKVGGNPNPGGDPVVPLVWLANHLPEHGLQLEAGQVVTTGTWTGLIFVERGARVTGGFAGFGEVSVDLI
jgi:2-keto-4-pentenoate hydratase